MAAKNVATGVKYLLGTCLPSSKEFTTKVRVRTLCLNEALLMYYNKHEFIHASDPKQKCKPGDTVLIRTLPQKMTRLITHEVVKIVYPLGDITDPITGKKVVVGLYRDEIMETNELMGKLDSAFDYEKAPPRGSQEDKRDFSHKEIYRKYNEDPDDPQPYAI